MKKIFLSFSFGNQDRELVAAIEQLMASHNVAVVTGRRLGGGALTPAIQALIDGSDGLVALLTRRDQLTGGGWTTHPWVRDELNYARNRNQRAIALVETDVDPGGAYAEHERIPFDRDHPFDTILALSETIGLWKQEAGRLLKVCVKPENLVRQAARGGVCRYRFTINGQFTPWQEAILVPEPGGTFLYLNGVRDDYLIQVQVGDGVSNWETPATGQYVTVELQQEGGGG